MAETKERNMLNMKEQFKLSELVQNLYVKSGLSDNKFAEEMNKAHGTFFRKALTGANVFAVRNALNIPANYVKSAPALEAHRIAERVAALEEQVAKL